MVTAGRMHVIDGATAPLQVGGRPPAVTVLEADPDLADALPEDARAEATRRAMAPKISLDPGPWRFFPPPERGALGALVLDGLVTVRLSVAERGHIELVGAGDVVSPWSGTDGVLATPSHVTATVVRPTTIAYLNRRFCERIADWPELHTALMQRLFVRNRRLAFQAAVNALPRMEERLELTLWHLADRMGRVTPAGVAVELPITHAELGELVGAQRPSVTTGLKRLVEAGRLVRAGRHSWLLLGRPTRAFERLSAVAGLP